MLNGDREAIQRPWCRDLLVSRLTHSCHLLTAEACTLHGTRPNCPDVTLPESPSLPDSAASVSLLISLDVSLFFLALVLCLLHFCLCLPRTWSFPRAEHRVYDITVKTQALETDAWVPVLTLLHPSCATSATSWTFLGTVPPSPSLEANNSCITFSVQN